MTAGYVSQIDGYGADRSSGADTECAYRMARSRVSEASNGRTWVARFVPRPPSSPGTLPPMPRAAKATAEPKPTTRRSRTMTADHKAVLAVGRDEGRAIRRYLEALEANKPRRGRRRTRVSVERQLAETLDRLTKASALDRVQLLQRRLDLEQELEAMSSGTDADLGELEAGFLAAAGPYSERKGLTYAAWREAGVDPRVLKQAGISRRAG